MKLPRYILAIDPGTTHSGWVEWDTETKAPIDTAGPPFFQPDIPAFGKNPNEEVDSLLKRYARNNKGAPLVAIEMINAQGQPVGATTFETCVWIGKFLAAYPKAIRVDRRVIKKHHCPGVQHPKDGTVAQAVRDKYGQKGTKANPGPFYGVSGDVWQAIALATYVQETWVE